MAGEGLEILLLGPVEVRFDGRTINVGGARQRALLANLALQIGRVVASARLIDDLWGSDPPASAGHAVEASVSRLRGVLRAAGADGCLVTRSPGYAIEIEPARIDAHRFAAIAGEASAVFDAGDPERASALLAEALGLWRGSALADLDGTPFAVVAAQRLEAERIAVVERRIDADLASGRHLELVGELEGLVAANPFHERFHEQLVVALYRAGRQRDALSAYSRARETLVGELGVEPRPELQRLQAAILRQDPDLDAPGGPGRPSREDRATEAPASRWRRMRAAFLATASVLTAIVLVVLGLPLLVEDEPRAAILENGVGVFDVEDGSLIWDAQLPDALEEMAAGAGSVWATSSETRTLFRFDAHTYELVGSTPVGAGAGALAIGGEAVWVANAFEGTVSRVDIGTGRVVQTVDVGGAPTGVAFGEDGVWVAAQTSGTVSRIDPDSGEVVAVVSVSAAPNRVAVTGGSIWVTSRTANAVIRVDPVTGRSLQTIAVGGGPDTIAAAFGRLWVANAFDSTVSVIDPVGGIVVGTIPVGLEPTALAVADGALWVASSHDGTVVRLDPHSLSITETLRVGDRPGVLAGFGAGLWVGSGAAAAPEHRGGTLRLLFEDPPRSADPVLGFPTHVPMVSLAYDTLVAFDHVGGAAGTQLVPDLAVAIPAPTRGGTEYTFVVREGIRYSDGGIVEPADFRYSFERALSLNPATVPFFPHLVGASSCTRHPPVCDLSRGIVVDDAARTVSFRLTEPDPAFLYKLALSFLAPVPPSVPRTETAAEIVPSTGPYAIVHVALPETIEFARNPWFRPWSTAARPDGYADRVVWRFGLSVPAQFGLIERGSADWTYDQPGALLERLVTRVPAQVHSNPQQNLDYAFLNTRVPPFDDRRVRQALNLALDRDAIVELFGGPDAAVPACQILPPTIPGHVPYCPYTTNPSDDGEWTGPDLDRARRLIAESGTAGMRVTYWSLPDEPWAAGIGRAVVALLDELGYRARLRVLPYASWSKVVHDSRAEAQIGTGGWVADYPAASNFFSTFLRCDRFVEADPTSSTNRSEFCRPALDRLMDLADRLQFVDPIRSNRLWARIDRRIVDLAPWVPVVNERWIDVTSERVGNYQYNPVMGVLLDQLWVR
jgi:peptide/nickel transport system substrate-binding protein